MTGRSAAHGYDTGAWVPARTPPSWLASVGPPRVVLRPGPVLPLVVSGVATALWVLVVGYGAVRLDPAWSALAGLLGLGALALVLRGLPLPAAPVVLAAVACWAFVARDWVPESAGDLAGAARLVAGCLAFAVPLVLAGFAAIWADGRRTARAAVEKGLGGRRWFGVNRGDPEPQLPALEQVPAALFFALPSGQSSHLVVAGRRAALVATTVWPRGEYGVEKNQVVRNGRPYSPGTDEVDGTVDDVRRWQLRLGPVGATCRAFLVVHPASGRLTDTVRVDLPPVEGVQVLAADRFVEEVGAFLAADANEIAVDVLLSLTDLYTQPEP
ncbi:hypothetical protein [Virgisporangium ochraceum]|uniref:Uncharacterized protein n=1 Tax=Virgisporangium ochraceum TaxID=65505 RepID=A0A8J4EBD9_9ACTN|nr:hypothetical protein [Virgisporangium ochraceum]GIJ69265.1 hypothetical protein Voc01_041820 [Virgisporangium ochraceum]